MGATVVDGEQHNSAKGNDHKRNDRGVLLERPGDTMPSSRRNGGTTPSFFNRTLAADQILQLYAHPRLSLFPLFEDPTQNKTRTNGTQRVQQAWKRTASDVVSIGTKNHETTERSMERVKQDTILRHVTIANTKQIWVTRNSIGMQHALLQQGRLNHFHPAENMSCIFGLDVMGSVTIT